MLEMLGLNLKKDYNTMLDMLGLNLKRTTMLEMLFCWQGPVTTAVYC